MSYMFPRWKYAVVIVSAIVGLIYALPNLYGEDPSIQITWLKNPATAVKNPVAGLKNTGLAEDKADNKANDKTADNIAQVKTSLEQAQIKYKSIEQENNTLLVRLFSTEVQIVAQDVLKNALGNDYSVALNLAPITPKWLDRLGAKPMKLGLDLRGGVRFLIEVDVAASMARNMESELAEIRAGLRKENIRYDQLSITPIAAQGDGHTTQNFISISFADQAITEQAQKFLRRNYPQHEIIANNNLLEVRMSPQLIAENKTYTLEQTMATLRNRINELGVAEAIVQRQGVNFVVVELPGIQDTARARDILGKTATLDFVMVDSDADLSKAMRGVVPPGRRLLYERHGRPVVVKKHVVLTGDSIIGASSSIDTATSKPAVSVRLGGSSIGLFKKTTSENVGREMAVIYRETKVNQKIVAGKNEIEKITTENIISVATIQSALGSQFQITGLSMTEARDLALLLRAGALPATISIVEERVIGPSMGQDNIQKGIVSIVTGVGAVLLFMTLYYSAFGVVANIGLLLNLILLVATMSLVGATLTLPGIAGIVLTLGMAVDANVLIFERIREELRSGMSPPASIQHGFKCAFNTILDSNLTTLIVGIILFAIGTGPVRGFAVTLCLGILTTLFTAVTGTRAIVHFVYGAKNIKRLPIGV